MLEDLHGAPLLSIIGNARVPASQTDSSQTDSRNPIHDACNLMVTCKAFRSAIKDCMGMLPVACCLAGWHGTAEKAAGFAGASSASVVPTCSIDAADHPMSRTIANAGHHRQHV
jgi:hypothetical protein